MAAQELAETSITELLKRFKGGLMVAFHALLNGQRLLFLGHSQPAGAPGRERRGAW